MPNVTLTRALAQQTQGELRHQVDAATVHDAIGAREPQLEDRLRCYLIYIGLDAQAYNAFSRRWHELERSGARTLEVATMSL